MHELAHPGRQGVAQQLDGSHVAGHDDQLGSDPVHQTHQLLGDVVGVALPGVLGPLLEAPLGPAPRPHLAQGVVVAPRLPLQVGPLAANADQVSPLAVGADHHVGQVGLAPFDEGSEGGKRAPLTEVGVGPLGVMLHVTDPRPVGDHRQTLALLVGTGHYGVDGLQHVLACALIGER